MQLSIVFICRECGRANTFDTDTIHAGEGPLEPVVGNTLFDGRIGRVHELHCDSCGHVSGELGLHYRYGENHVPSHDKELPI